MSVAHVADPLEGSCNSFASGTRGFCGSRCANGHLKAAIEGAVSQVFGVEHAELFRATRGKAPVALARQVAMYLAHVACGLSFTEVGILFGRDRTTAAHACRVIEDRRDDPVFDRALELLEWALPTLISPRASTLMMFG